MGSDYALFIVKGKKRSQVPCVRIGDNREVRCESGAAPQP